MTSSPRVLLVAASVRWAAQSARRGGRSVIGMDLFGDTDTLAACERFELISEDLAVDPVGLRVRIDEIARAEKAIPLIAGGLRASDIDPTAFELQRVCRGSVIRFPPIRRAAPATSGPQRWLIKPIRSGGGLGIRFVRPGETPEHASTTDPDSTERDEMYFQQFVPGRGYGLVAIADGHETRILGLTRSLRQRAGDMPFIYSGSAGPVPTTDLPNAAIRELVDRIAVNHSIRGLFNLDFIRDHDGRWWLIEVNVRPSGSCEVIENAAWQTGRLDRSDSLMQMHVDAIAGKPVHWDDVDGGVMYVKRIVYAKADGVFEDSYLSHRQDDSDYLADVPANRTRLVAGHPVATIVTRLPMDWRRYRRLISRLDQRKSGFPA